jgi:hypothetical protein
MWKDWKDCLDRNPGIERHFLPNTAKRMSGSCTAGIPGEEYADKLIYDNCDEH